MIINKDVTTLVAPFMLIHVVNNKNVMGAGVAAAIAAKWPQVKADYHATFNRKPLPSLLGSVILTKVAERGYVASLFAQDGYGTDKRYLDYAALDEAIQEVRRIATSLDLPVHAPYLIGCGLAGGNWEIVQPLIEKRLEVTFCKLSKLN